MSHPAAQAFCWPQFLFTWSLSGFSKSRDCTKIGLSEPFTSVLAELGLIGVFLILISKFGDILQRYHPPIFFFPAILIIPPILG